MAKKVATTKFPKRTQLGKKATKGLATVVKKAKAQRKSRSAKLAGVMKSVKKGKK